MSTKNFSPEEKKGAIRKSKEGPEAKSDSPKQETPALIDLQQRIGNRAVQRLLAQRSEEGPYELDDETASQINRQRGAGQSLDSGTQARMGKAAGHDFSAVRVHTGDEAHVLNEQLSAKAFTTGQDIFFRNGAYDPGSSGGQELLAHELTHVVQQSSGRVGGGGRMTVNAPGDAFEQEADQVARTVSSTAAAGGVQLQEEEEKVQEQELPEDEEQVQRQVEENEEEEKEEEEA